MHLSGVKVPPLGSMQDRVFRSYMTLEDQLEVEKMKFNMLIALTNPKFEDANKFRDWSSSVSSSWKKYLSLQFGIEVPQEAEDEIKMREYYETVVKHLKPKIKKAKKGYEISGLNKML